jgi:hypothetical protein
MNYFTFFNLKPKVFININALDEAYQNIQKLLHPDIQKNDLLNMNAAMALSSKASIAYDTLKNPLLSISHLLALKGRSLDLNAGKITDPNILNDVLDIQEQIENDLVDKEKISLSLTLTLQNIAKEIEEAYELNEIQMLEGKALHFSYLFNLKKRIDLVI